MKKLLPTALLSLAAVSLFGSAPANAQARIVHYDPVGDVNELNLQPAMVRPGLTATGLGLNGGVQGTFLNSYHALGWTNGATPDLSEYLEFTVDGGFAAGSIQHHWFASSFGPTRVAVRTSLDGFASDVDVAAKANNVTLDLTSLGFVAGPITFRLYYYNGLPVTSPDLNTLFIDGSAFNEMGLGLFEPDPTVFVSLCNGDGGDQMGCTSCPCGNNAAVDTVGGCLNSAGSSAELVVSGGASASSDTLRMEVLGATLNSFAILASGNAVAPQNAANPCFGTASGLAAGNLDGLRCAVNAVQRHGVRATDANGDVGVTGNGWGPPSGPVGGLVAQGGFVAGQTRFYQVFYRENIEAGCQTGQNTTQAVRVIFTP